MNIVIVENNSAFGEALKIYIENELKHNVLKIFKSGEEFLEHICTLHVQIILIDVKMPFMDGYETGKLYNFKNWTIPMIAITMDSDYLNLRSLIENGFKAGLLKTNIDRDLERAIELVSDGKFYFPDMN